MQIIISLITLPTLSKRHLSKSLAQLQGHLGIARRFIRLFRFLDAFHTAYTLVSRPYRLTAEACVDVLSNTFNGLYLLFESATIVDAMRIDGLAIWGPEYERLLKIESQRCWFLALVCGAVVSGLRLSSTRRELAMQIADQSGKMEVPDEKNGDNQKLDADEQRERRERRETKRAALEKATRAHTRRLVANVLDLPLPGSVVGWIRADPLTLGLAMMTTSALTGFDVWERCGREGIP